MGRLGNSRLLELADHLESANLGHDQFDLGIFSTFVSGKRNQCGTAGCAIGECPFAFPNDWKFSSNGYPILSVNGDQSNIFGDAEKFFELPGIASSHLFSPGDQEIKIYGGKYLKRNATPKEVAGNIREFVRRNTSPWDKMVMSVRGFFLLIFK
jgi:hypothetical protein